MKKYLKMLDRKCGFVLFTISVLFTSLFCYLNVSADYYDCLYSSGGREGIDSVQWACGKNPPACSLWIGGSNGQSTTFYVESDSGVVTAYMWGMCTGYAISAVNVSVSNDNNSFYDDGGMSVWRGEWGYPTSTPISVNIGRFISGVSPYTTSEGYKAYNRKVNIYRCNGENPVSCSSQDSSVTIVVKKKPGYDRVEEKEEIRDGRSESFNINASSSVVSVSNSKRNENGIYELLGENARVDYEHRLWHSNYVFSPSVSYYNESASGTVTISGGNGVTINGQKTGTVKLSTEDRLENVCQNIRYWSKTWTYRYKQKWVIKYNVHYDGDGNEIGRDKISETPVGAEYVDVNSLVGSNEGASTDACAYLHRPWNFKVVSVDNNTRDGDMVYVGETLTPSFVINVVKNNSELAVTDIPKATISLCYGLRGSEKCENAYNKTIHAEGGVNDSTDYSYHNFNSYNVNIVGSGVTVEDLPAGAEYCVVFKMSPSDSGNGYYSGFNRNTIVSEKCYKIAKRPSVQVWGGNVVSGGNISAGMIRKKDKMFGSWGELGVTGGGKIVGFASGASLADGSNSDSRKLVGLSFANVGVSGDRLGGNFNVNIENINKDKNAIIEKIEASDLATDLLPEGAVEGYVYIKKEGNLIIDRNIEYTNRTMSLNDMPKVFIYATGDIKINCNVTRLDAIMVAEGIVNTCVDENGETPDENAKNRSNQLKVNGIIIAKELRLNRTYGAAAGVYSDVPAEIINYDPTIELITIKSGDDRIKGLNSVYTHELAPRY